MSEASVTTRQGAIFGLLMFAGWLVVSFVAAHVIRVAEPVIADAADCAECALTGYVPCSAAPKNCPLCSLACCSVESDRCCCVHSDRCPCVPPPTRGPGQ